MQKQSGQQTEKRPPVGWALLAVLCAAAFWLGQALVTAAGGGAPAAPDGLSAAGGGTARPTPAPTAAPTPTPAPTLPENGRTVCLTFDDGPSANTEAILQILQEKGVPATFFVVAYEGNQKYMPYIADILAQGHQLAMHSASHDYAKIYQSDDAFWQDIAELRQALEPYTDLDAVKWLRFPGGSTNTVSYKYGGKGLMQTLMEQCAEKGYEWIDWNVSAEDATRKRPDAAQILTNIRHDAEGRDNCVVLMHDTKATGETVKALPDIIDWFREEGYTFMTVERMHALRAAAESADAAA